ncbi:hypothetical protein TDMWS_21500 [Thermodesulfomicrobium sp. WS]|uniref:type II secretion system protein n=1 Tax=Thermodesulfomicrobium sp. WS TaxID=3004129 RepID=UPI002493A5FF|nr:prepilin-type N-terminal cleavage/methylation domain-containing protein [Thermodesulfomicrobium sp. WS]BDV02065.1 hypothetical protein TDMWS_21500 [Thermodesulfomicrobium sp. WS]
MIQLRSMPPTGFSLLEVSIALVIIGLLFAVGALSWSALAETRRLAKARAQLLEVRDCMLRASLLHEHYPSDTDFLRCSNETGLDPWGGDLRMVRGVTTAGLPLDESFAVVTDAARGQLLTLPDGNASRAILLPEGENRTSIAFAVISLGKNRVADHPSVAGLNTNAIVPLSASMDFSSPTKDDVVLPVQAYEVMGYLRNVVGPQ